MTPTATTQPVSSEAQRPSGHAARGKVIEARPGLVVFQPRGTNYELHLAHEGEYTGPTGRPTQGTIRVRARKLYTVPSGGNFVAPILGSPRTIQGRVVEVLPRSIVVQAGPLVHVDLPEVRNALELAEGPIEEGAIVNVVAFPGATYEPAQD